MEMDSKMVLAIIPLLLIQITLIIVCLLDWRKRKHFKTLNKWAWLAIIVFVNMIGPILYLTIGKANDDN